MRWRTYARMISLLACLCVLCLNVSSALAKKKPPVAPVNLNTATSAQLQEVPGIGPATADKILQMRKSYGPFKSVDDLLAVRGIGPKRLEKMRKYLVAGKAPASKATPSSANAAGTKAAPTNAGSAGTKFSPVPAAKKTPPAAKSPTPATAASKSADAKTPDTKPAPDAKAASDPKVADPKDEEDEEPPAAA
jgi:comEA protein